MGEGPLIVKWIKNRISSGSPEASDRTILRDVLILTALVLLFCLPFINQAFHWDDRDYIEFTQVQARDITQFHLSDYSYRGHFIRQFRNPHAPLLTTYLSLLLRTGAQVSEPLFHAAYLVFPLVAALSMYALSRRFTRHPLIAAILLVSTPGFLVMSHNIMDNFPGLSLSLASAALFIWGADKGNWKLLLGSGIMMALAVMTAYQSLAIVPVLMAYALLNRNFQQKTYLPFIIPLAVYGLWRMYIKGRYGHVPAISYKAGLHFDWQIRSMIVFIGGTIIFPLSFLVLFLRSRLDIMIAFLAFPPLITWTAIYCLGRGEIDSFQAFQLAILIAAGFMVIYRMFAAGVSGLMGWAQNRKGWADPVFLLVWFLGVILVQLVFMIPYVAVRHLLLLFPPVILLFVREAEALWPMRPRLRGAFVYITLGLTMFMGLSAAYADYRMAGTYREVAGQMKEMYGDSPNKVWLLGEFDFRYYMEREGFEYLGVNSVAKSGDFVISSYVCSTGVVAPLPEGYYRVLSREEPSSGYPVRSMNPWGAAGFYGNLLGPLPFSISGAKLDEIDVNQLDLEMPVDDSGTEKRGNG
ncbi:MAG: glycosyltransferase family 39 protein [Thermoleophilia bacterium]